MRLSESRAKLVWAMPSVSIFAVDSFRLQRYNEKGNPSLPGLPHNFHILQQMLFLTILTGWFPKCFLYVTREMRHILKVHQVWYFGQGLRSVIEQRNQLEWSIELYPLWCWQSCNGSAYLGKILWGDAKQVCIIVHLALRSGILLSQSQKAYEYPRRIVWGVHLR